MGILCMYLSKCTYILSSCIKLEEICSYFPRNCLINPGVNFWASVQCGESTTLFKIPFLLWMSLLTWFSSFHFPFFLFYVPVPRQMWVCTYISVWDYIHTNMYIHKCVYLPREGGRYGLWIDSSGYELQIHEGTILLPPSSVQLTIKPQT